MSSEAHAHHDAHGDDHHHHDGASHGTFKSYMIGFILSVILTAIPFWLVMGDVLENKTLLVIEHDMDAVFALADRVSVLVQGRIVATGAAAEVAADERVREAYLGVPPGPPRDPGRTAP